MILRRVIKHVKDQNWFAVGIDFLIVVLGVFVGLQVQQWATEQETRQREGVYVERLHGETMRLIEQRKSNLEGRIANRDLLITAHRKLFSNDNLSEFTPEECRALSVIHVMTDLTTDLPTLTELISAGQLNTIRSTELRASLIRLLQLTTRSKDSLDGINRNAVVFLQKHPDLITFNMDIKDEGNPSYDIEAECNVQEMRKSRAFLNDFVEGHFRYVAYVDGVLMSSEELLKLHTVLDGELSITHDKVTP